MSTGEPDVIRAARCGHGWAWEQLYRSSYPGLRAYCTHRAGSEACDDIVAETWSRVIGGIDRYRWSPVGFDAWLFGIARRVIADHHRQVGRLRILQLRDPAPAPQVQPGEDLLDAVDREAVRRGFRRLSAADRELLELRVVAARSAEEVAAILGRRPGAVRTAQHRALRRLRELVEREAGVPQ